MVIALMMLALITACGDKEASNKGPSHIPVKWANAVIQKDQSTMSDLLLKKSDSLNSEQKSKNDKTIKEYTLTEFKKDEKSYYYSLEYQDPESNQFKTENMEIVKTGKGWKKTQYLSLANFNKLVQDIKPKKIKEEDTE